MAMARFVKNDFLLEHADTQLQIPKEGVPANDLDETRLPTGQCTPEEYFFRGEPTPTEVLAAFNQEPIDRSLATAVACKLSAEKAKPAPPRSVTQFKRRSWADIMEDSADDEPASPVQSMSKRAPISLGEALAQPSRRGTPDMRSWASTPNPSSRPHGAGTTGVACPGQEERQRIESQILPAPRSADETSTRADAGSSDSALLRLISGLREAADLE